MLSITVIDVLGCTFAAYYITEVIMWQAGPFGIFDIIRSSVFGVAIERAEGNEWRRFITRPGTLADLMTCRFCCGFWVSLCVVGLWMIYPYSVLVFALPGMVVLVAGIVGE